MCMSFVAVGRSLTIVSYVAFKMAALWFWTMFNCNPSIAHCHRLLWGGGILVDHWSTISSFNQEKFQLFASLQCWWIIGNVRSWSYIFNTFIQCGKLNFWSTRPKTDVPYLFCTKVHSTRPIFYSPSSKCTRIGERASISFHYCYLFFLCKHGLWMIIMNCCIWFLKNWYTCYWVWNLSDMVYHFQLHS